MEWLPTIGFTTCNVRIKNRTELNCYHFYVWLVKLTIPIIIIDS